MTIIDPFAPAAGPQEWTQLDRQDLTGASEVAWDSAVITGYEDFRLVCSNVLANSAGAELRFQVSSNNGSSFMTASAVDDIRVRNNTAVYVGTRADTTDPNVVSLSDGANYHSSADFAVRGAGVSGPVTFIDGTFHRGGRATVEEVGVVSYCYPFASVVNYLRIRCSVSTFSRGYVELYARHPI